MKSSQMESFKKLKNEITRFMMMYKFALDEMETKIEILKEEFQLLHDYNPIEHTKSRVKSPESIMHKIYRKNCAFSLPVIKETIQDIAGLRITCSFVSDIYRIHDMLKVQKDLTIVQVKDYIATPKLNGYQSLHLLVEVPVYMSDRQEKVMVEVQIRTIAMDFWASLEHKLYYKYNKAVPEHLVRELKEAADSAAALDQKMERLHREVQLLQEEEEEEENDILPPLLGESERRGFFIPPQLLELISGEKPE